MEAMDQFHIEKVCVDILAPCGCCLAFIDADYLQDIAQYIKKEVRDFHSAAGPPSLTSNCSSTRAKELHGIVW